MTFYEMLATHYDEVFPLREAQVRFVGARISAGGRILDAGCATGALATRLARGGYRVEALDFEPLMIALAEAREGAADVDFATGDMREITTDRRDGILTLGNTLVHLRGEGLERFLSRAAASLEGGPLILQILNYDRILRESIRELPLIDTPNVRFERRYSDGEDGALRFEVRLTDKTTGETSTSATELFPLTSAALEDHLRRAGFTKIDLYGAFDERPFAPDSYPLIACARR